MTGSALVEKGLACEGAGDFSGAEQAYREASEAGDAEGAIRLGLLHQRRGATQEAIRAFTRAEDLGHREGGMCLGNVLSDAGEHGAAEAAYSRAIRAGSSDAIVNFGLLLAEQGRIDEAIAQLRLVKEPADLPLADWAIGAMLEKREDLQGAAEHFRRSAQAGNPQAAFGLGAVLLKLADPGGARAAFEQAQELGHAGAAEALETLDINQGARASVEAGARWARLYAQACDEVLSAANACLEIANQAIAARNMAELRPQAEVSIRHFVTVAEQKEKAFFPRYQDFASARDSARESAAQLLASQSDPDSAEMVLAFAVEEATLDIVATAKGILSATTYGPTPSAFLRGVEESNEIIAAGNAGMAEGNIYRTPLLSASDERTCPWCAETIKAAALVCRYCGREVQTPPNVG